MTALEALSDPTRLRIVRRLAEGPARLEDLAEAAGVHPNTVRAHVASLQESGVVEQEAAESDGRGRPPLRYRLEPGWTPPTTDFGGLAELLAATLVRTDAPEDLLRAVGREWGRYLLGRPGVHDLDRELPRALERLGFEPSLEDGRLTLRACPCRLILPGRPKVLCGLAVAVVEGMVEASGTELRVADSTHDPEARCCSVTLA
jgi:predicted ArsR family transcriptional regulator